MMKVKQYCSISLNIVEMNDNKDAGNKNRQRLWVDMSKVDFIYIVQAFCFESTSWDVSVFANSWDFSLLVSLFCSTFVNFLAVASQKFGWVYRAGCSSLYGPGLGFSTWI